MSSTTQLIETAITAQPSSADSHVNLEIVPGAEFNSELRKLSQSFVDTQRTGHPFQLADWSTETSSLFLIVRQFANIQAFARCDIIWPLGKRFDRIRALTLTRGPVCDDPVLMRGVLGQLVAVCRARGFLYLDINPDWTDADAEDLAQWLESHSWFAAGPARESLRVDLRPELGNIFGSFRKTTRSEIRRAQDAGVEISVAGADSIERFLRMYVEMARAKGFAPDPEHHMRRVLAWLIENPGRGVLLTAASKAMILGGVVAVRAGSRCWYVWGATQKDSDVNVGHLLQWHAMQWAKEQGCTEYDLGGYREGATDGPALFKKGFSQKIFRFLPNYRHAVNSGRYSIYSVLVPCLSKVKALLGSFNSSRPGASQIT
jgi:Acetyltransferase (GNAT) domain